MKAWHVNRRRRASRKRKRREGDGRGGWDDGEGGKRVEKSQCKSCSLLLVADNSFYKEVRSIILYYCTLSLSDIWVTRQSAEIIITLIKAVTLSLCFQVKSHPKTGAVGLWFT